MASTTPTEGMRAPTAEELAHLGIYEAFGRIAAFLVESDLSMQVELAFVTDPRIDFAVSDIRVPEITARGPNGEPLYFRPERVIVPIEFAGGVAPDVPFWVVRLTDASRLSKLSLTGEGYTLVEAFMAANLELMALESEQGESNAETPI